MCVDDDDCGDVSGARCLGMAGGARCAEPCDPAGVCPGGYVCSPDSLCVPAGGSCLCEAGDHFDLACALRDPVGRVCAGDQRCDDGTLTACVAPIESCNGLDDDCDGDVDEDYRDGNGAYSVDERNCGGCGIDCTASPVPEGDLVCGGDVFAPSCVLECPDTLDGVQVGDRVDGDRDIASGCECTVGALVDEPGPIGASGQTLDVNCDGADGRMLASIYVATDGDDAWPGSPTRPLRTIGRALAMARDSLAGPSPRAHVFVANGVYAEVVRMPSGVHLHGGYRRDFLALDPSGFVTEVRAPNTIVTAFGEVLALEAPTTAPTTIAWIRFVGADAGTSARPAVAAVLDRPSPALRIDRCELIAGAPAMGAHGRRGDGGASPTSAATDGAPPRAAIEDANHLCVAGSANTVAGGRGGANTCGVDVGGGNGASPGCPVFTAFAPTGMSGRGPAATPGGAGGNGGQDSNAPISGAACPNQPVCCGLADFTVPTNFQTPEPGANGRLGSAGNSGTGCGDAWGVFTSTTWTAGRGSDGSNGGAGSGGGGGGGGGGVEYDWVAGMCAFVDGLGGGGGGGGAGGCGGGAGSAGGPGAPSIALLILPNGIDLPVLVSNRIVTNDGGRGGDGGAGGAGGEGGIGGFGREIPRSQRTTPTLAGPFSGGRGGRGGDGGSGGGGGGGCGGASVGVFITGQSGEPPAVAGYRADNVFSLGAGGVGGRGGGSIGSVGAAGGARDVVARP